jgi:hypothetical protein
VLGPKNYLSNLKKLGFKTFSSWWDESYDYCEGVHRIEEIKNVLKSIFTKSSDELQEMLSDMKETLEYNYNHYMDDRYE